MIATITTRAPKFSSSHRKENKGLHKCYAMLAPSKHNPGEATAIAELRIYWAGSTAYACLWIHSPEQQVYTSGSGKAGGYGYDKQSAAAGAAIRNAGFDLSEDIDGRGETAIREAMKALAVAVGYPEAMIFETHP